MSLELHFEREVTFMGGDARRFQRGKDFVIFKRGGFQRFEVWLDPTEDSEGLRVFENTSVVKGVLTRYNPPVDKAEITHARPHDALVWTDLRLFPLLLDQALDSCVVEQVRRHDGVDEVQWIRSNGAQARRITGAFSEAPPHDLLWLTIGSEPGSWTQRLDFSEYVDIGDELRYPREITWVIETSRGQNILNSRVEQAHVNMDIADSRFFIHLPAGTRVRDSTQEEHLYIVGGTELLDEVEDLVADLITHPNAEFAARPSSEPATEARGIGQVSPAQAPRTSPGEGPRSIAARGTVRHWAWIAMGVLALGLAFLIYRYGRGGRHTEA